MNDGLSDLATAKASLRTEVRFRLAGLTSDRRLTDSRTIVEKALALSAWREARAVALFVPLADEPSIWPIAEASLNAGKTVGVPGYDPASATYVFRRIAGERDLVRGRYGVGEPGPACDILATACLDLAFVPGICFSSDGGRLGRGKGFYDRLLQPFRGVSCGVGFDLQIVPAVPSEPHDVKLNLVLTPTRLFVAATSV